MALLKFILCSFKDRKIQEDETSGRPDHRAGNKKSGREDKNSQKFLKKIFPGEFVGPLVVAEAISSGPTKRKEGRGNEKGL